MKKIAALLGGIGFVAITGSAAAMQYTWSLNQVLDGQSAASCGGSDCQLIFASNEALTTALKLRAYSTSSTGSPSTGNFQGADIAGFSDGIAIDNSVPSGETSSGQNYIDNAGVVDVLVFEAPTDNFDWESLTLGSITNDTTPDVQAYVGGIGANKNFTSLCFSGCTGGNVDLVTDGFTPLGPISSAANAAINFGPNTVGRYLVVSGALNETDDFFRVAAVGGHTIPSPQTLPLLALGLVGMWAVMRRRVGT